MPRVYPRNVAIVVLLMVMVPFLWLSLFSQQDVGSSPWTQVENLKARLELSETINKNKDAELESLKEQFRRAIEHQEKNGSNSSSPAKIPPRAPNLMVNGTVELKEAMKLLDSKLPDDITEINAPSVYHYLPHLMGNHEALKPGFKLSQKRKKVSLVFGVPTIKRDKQEYLVDTLRSLIENLNEEEKRDVLIVIMVAEPWDLEYVKSTAAKVQSNFKTALDEGLLELISPPAGFYPDLDNLKENFGDSKERVKWRTKQNLDFAFLMMYCRNRGDYYVQLEDDIVTKPGYVSMIKKFAEEQKRSDYVLLQFSQLGFIGKLFKTTDLSMVAEFFLMFHTDKPIDWLLDHILYVKACNPEKDNKHCQRSKQELAKRFKPSLFQHTGLHSSLKGKVQKIKDKDFGKAILHRAHLNPAADVATSLKIYQRYSLERAYVGETYFWALLPQAKDFVIFKFDYPQNIESYLFKSGNIEHSTDKFFNTSVDLLPESAPSLNETETKLYKKLDDGYYEVGRFLDSGIAEDYISPHFGKINAIRLTCHAESENWAILSEIYIKQRSTARR